MSNRLTIEPTEFHNIRTGKKTLGVRVYDDYDQQYLDAWDEIPDNDMDVLEKLIKYTESYGDLGGVKDAMLDHVQENQKGVYIGGEWYDWDQIKSLFAGR